MEEIKMKEYQIVEEKKIEEIKIVFDHYALVGINGQLFTHSAKFAMYLKNVLQDNGVDAKIEIVSNLDGSIELFHIDINCEYFEINDDYIVVCKSETTYKTILAPHPEP